MKNTAKIAAKVLADNLFPETLEELTKIGLKNTLDWLKQQRPLPGYEKEHKEELKALKRVIRYFN